MSSSISCNDIHSDQCWRNYTILKYLKRRDLTKTLVQTRTQDQAVILLSVSVLIWMQYKKLSSLLEFYEPGFVCKYNVWDRCYKSLTGKFFAEKILAFHPGLHCISFWGCYNCFSCTNILQCLTWKSHAIILWMESFSCSKKYKYFDQLYRENLQTSFLICIYLTYPALKYTFEVCTAWKLCGWIFFLFIVFICDPDWTK